MTPQEREQAVREEMEHRHAAVLIQRALAFDRFREALENWQNHIREHGLDPDEEWPEADLWQRLLHARSAVRSAKDERLGNLAYQDDGWPRKQAYLADGRAIKDSA